MESLQLTLAPRISEPHVTSVLTSDRKRIEEILISHGFDKIKPNSGRSLWDTYSPELSFENIRFELIASPRGEKSYGKLSISYPIDAKLKLIYDHLISALQNEVGIELLATDKGSYKPNASPYSRNHPPRTYSSCNVLSLVR